MAHATGTSQGGVRASAPAEGTGRNLYREAKRLIPGGTQLLSKRPEMFLPEHWPAYFRRARGVEVWDLDGRRYVDMSVNGLGTSILGAADPDVDAAVRGAIDAGTVSTLNCPEEAELARLLTELHPWADMVRYARGGGEAMAVAIRIARARTGRDRVAFCGYHGWHDWYLAANLGETRALDGHLLPGLAPRGVPRGLAGTALPFRYNHSVELKDIVTKHGGELAAIVMEPIRDREPVPGFLEDVRELADAVGAVLIFDEVSAGFRLCCGGAHLTFGIDPDMAAFAKGMGNGYPMAAVIGRESVMEAAQGTFISSTNWTERIGPVAALATIRKHREHRVHEHLIRIGASVKEVWRDAAHESGLPLDVSGIDPMGWFSVRHEEKQAAHTLFTQMLLDRGFLAGSHFYTTFAHTDEHVASYREAVREAFGEIATALKAGDLRGRLRGDVAHSGFHRLT